MLIIFQFGTARYRRSRTLSWFLFCLFGWFVDLKCPVRAHLRVVAAGRGDGWKDGWLRVGLSEIGLGIGRFGRDRIGGRR